MDDVKRTYRDVEKDSKQAWRESDGSEGPADKIGDAGDEIRKDLGNAGDTAREVGQDVQHDVTDPRWSLLPRGEAPGLLSGGFAASRASSGGRLEGPATLAPVPEVLVRRPST